MGRKGTDGNRASFIGGKYNQAKAALSPNNNPNPNHNPDPKLNPYFLIIGWESTDGNRPSFIRRKYNQAKAPFLSHRKEEI
jgi:hypothetical protein